MDLTIFRELLHCDACLVGSIAERHWAVALPRGALPEHCREALSRGTAERHFLKQTLSLPYRSQNLALFQTRLAWKSSEGARCKVRSQDWCRRHELHGRRVTKVSRNANLRHAVFLLCPGHLMWHLGDSRHGLECPTTPTGR